MDKLLYNNSNMEYTEDDNTNPTLEFPTHNNIRIKHHELFTYQKSDNVIDNEDIYDVLQEQEKSVYILCDGASESFAAKEWAKIVAENFKEDQNISDMWIKDIISKYNEKYDYNNLSWSKQSSFLRGSFCTLLACTYIQGESYVSITAIGDSTVFKILKIEEKYKVIDSFPYKTPDKYRCRPELISTKHDDNIFIQCDCIDKFRKNIEISKDTIIVLATDALSEWIMTHDASDDLAKLLEIKYSDEFTTLIDTHRNNKSIKIDDTTFFKITF